MDNEVLKDTNVSAEMCFVGALFKNPDLYINYGNSMRSKYDFSDEAVKFFYDSFEEYYLTFSQTVDEIKMNVFMSQNEERLRMYKKYKGWNTIKRFMQYADETDCQNYFDIVKKYSLVREYGRNGFPVEKILSYKNFAKLTPNDIYRIIRTKADKIHTVINAGEDSVKLTSNMVELVDGYLKKPDFGLPFPWPMYNEYFLGQRPTKVLFEGFLSNEGKTRKMMLLAAYVTLVKHENFLLLSNEMDEADLKNCLLTTVINNDEFKELHGIKRMKPEKEIVLGVYKDDFGEIIRRKIDENGIYIETDEEYCARVRDNSSEYWDVKAVADWIDQNTKGELLFKDVGTDYSPEAIEIELRKAKAVNNVTYYGYDTLKGYNTDDWSAIKQFATRLKELTKELKMFGYAVFQLSDDTIFTDVFSLSSNNIANAKQIKHVVDYLNIGKKITLDEYYKYQYVSVGTWGDAFTSDLNPEKKYFAIKVDKNRAGSKDKIMLFEINLDYNIWKNVGYLIKRNMK